MKKYFPEGYIFETKENKEATKNLTALETCFKEEKIIEARALMCDSEHNLIVNLNGIKGIIPRNEGAIGISNGTVRDIAVISKVGKPVCFLITSFSEDENGEPLIYLSRKAAQEKATYEYLNYIYSLLNASYSSLEKGREDYMEALKKFGMTSEEFATKLLNEQKVAVVPGTAFGDCGEGFLRISYAYSLKNLKIAMERIRCFVDSLEKN